MIKITILKGLNCVNIPVGSRICVPRVLKRSLIEASRVYVPSQNGGCSNFFGVGLGNGFFYV